jgi:hypothetical protein
MLVEGSHHVEAKCAPGIETLRKAQAILLRLEGTYCDV